MILIFYFLSLWSLILLLLLWWRGWWCFGGFPVVWWWKIVFSGVTKHMKLFSRKIFIIQPSTWKFFPFRKIAFPKNKYFLENILHEPNAALETPFCCGVWGQEVWWRMPLEEQNAWKAMLVYLVPLSVLRTLILVEYWVSTRALKCLNTEKTSCLCFDTNNYVNLVQSSTKIT